MPFFHWKLKSIGGLTAGERAREAMVVVDRADFCPSHPYEDSPQPIGFNATISAPHMHLYALEAASSHLPLNKPSKVLDVGSGSGYLTVCFAMLGGSHTKVVGVEHVAELVEMSKENTRKSFANLLESGRVSYVQGDGRLGYAQKAPYDVIHVGAACEGYPQDLVDQLAPNGILIAPIGKTPYYQAITLIRKDEEGRLLDEEVTLPVRYVPLTDLSKQI